MLHVCRPGGGSNITANYDKAERMATVYFKIRTRTVTTKVLCCCAQALYPRSPACAFVPAWFGRLVLRRRRRLRRQRYAAAHHPAHHSTPRSHAPPATPHRQATRGKLVPVPSTRPTVRDVRTGPGGCGCGKRRGGEGAQCPPRKRERVPARAAASVRRQVGYATHTRAHCLRGYRLPQHAATSSPALLTRAAMLAP